LNTRGAYNHIAQFIEGRPPVGRVGKLKKRKSARSDGTDRLSLRERGKCRKGETSRIELK